MKTITSHFWDFFEPLAGAVTGVRTVNQSGGDKMDRLMQHSRSEDIYPAIFLLRPKYNLEDNGAGLIIAWFDATYYVICTGQGNTDEDEDALFDEAETMAIELTKEIRSQDNGYTVLNDPMAKVFMEPITMLTTDNNFGYEIRCRVGLMVNPEFYQ